MKVDKEKLRKVRDNIQRYHVFVKEHKRLDEQLNSDMGDQFSLSGLVGGFTGLQDTNLHKAKLRYEEILDEVLAIYSYAVEEHPNMRDVAVITCCIDGMNVNEISAHLSVSWKTAQRSLERVIKSYFSNRT